MELIIYLLIGAIAGFAAGLFGVGGGLIIVPILYIVFTQLNYDPSVLMHMAVGTSSGNHYCNFDQLSYGTP